MRILALAVLFTVGCAAPKATVTRKALPRVRPEAAQAVRDAARLYRLGPSYFGQAKERLEAAVQSSPQLFEAWFDLGRIDFAESRLEAAELAFGKALELLPSDRATVLALGEVRQADGKADAAIKLYRTFLDRNEAKRVDGENNEMKLALGSALRRAKKYDAATEIIREVLRRQPRSAAALDGLGLVYLDRGNTELADLVLHRAFDIVENDHERAKEAARIANNLGLVALKRRRADEAFAYFDQAERLDPTLTVARRNKALTYLDCGDYARAAEELADLVKSAPRDVDAWVALGVAERGRAQFDVAARAFDRALELDPHSADALYDLALLQMDFLRKPAHVRELLERFLKVAPANHAKRADAQARISDLDQKSKPRTEPKGGAS